MMSKNVYYLTFYCDGDSLGKREYPKSAQTKIDYIISALNRCDVSATVLSASGAIANCHQASSMKRLSSMALVEYCASTGRVKGASRVINILMVLIQLLFKLLRIKRDETLIVYHSPRFIWIVRLAKFVRKFKLILEVEEIYGEIFDKATLSARELRYFQLADAFILSTSSLDSLVNRFGRPSVVVHGAYTTNTPIRNESSQNDMIHLIYSGTFAQGKGASRAIEAMSFLPSCYVLHIAGYGTDIEQSRIQKQVEALSPCIRKRIVFEGMLLGREYDDLLYECEIGLCTQDAKASYTLSSFPSKVITYLTHFLSVVAIRIPTLEKSDISDIIHFYDDDSPESVARAVLSAGRPNRLMIVRKMAKLDEMFVERIRRIV